MAALTLRNTKGSALTFTELDSNFQALDSEVANLSTSLSSSYVTLNTDQTISGKKTFSGGTTSDPAITLTTADNTSSAAPIMDFVRTTAQANNADYLGQLKFKGEDSGGASEVYAKITAKIADATNGTEDGLLEYAVVSGGSNLILARMTGNGGGKFILENSTNLEVSGGNITVASGGDITIDGNSVVLDATNQTIAGQKTFNDTFTASNGVVLNGLTYPTTDGAINQFITTNGSGTLSFATVESYDSAKVQGQIDSNAPSFLSSGATDAYTSGTLTFNNGTTLTAAAGATVNFSNTTGTAPFTVSSTTKVSNLNADQVDGFNGIGIYDSAGTLLNGA